MDSAGAGHLPDADGDDAARMADIQTGRDPGTRRRTGQITRTALVSVLTSLIEQAESLPPEDRRGAVSAGVRAYRAAHPDDEDGAHDEGDEVVAYVGEDEDDEGPAYEGGGGGAYAIANGGFGAVPASGEAIASLRAVRRREARERDCAVCLEKFQARDVLRMMPCSHSFHQGCIFEWLRASGACPLCRHRLPVQQY